MDDAILERWVNINSGSHNVGGLRRMADALQEALAGLPGELERIALPQARELDGGVFQPGDALRLRFRPEAPVRVLFSGHMDTVFGPEHPFQAGRRLADGRLHGPGVADMKGGIFILIEAVKRFLREDRRHLVGGEILLTADEEVGSPASHGLLLEAAAWNHLGLVFESSLPGGELVRHRRGTGTFRITARGRSAHSGRDFENGRNAVVALAALALECHTLNARLPDATVNVGALRGGGPVNVVPDAAEAWLNIRIGDRLALHRVSAELDALIAGANTQFDGVTFALEGGFARAPKVEKPGDAALHALWNTAEERLGEPRSGQRDTGGSSDGNVLGEAGLPHLDGVGIRGGAIHSEEEFALPRSIPGQVARTVAFLELLSDDPACVQRPPLQRKP